MLKKSIHGEIKPIGEQQSEDSYQFCFTEIKPVLEIPLNSVFQIPLNSAFQFFSAELSVKGSGDIVITSAAWPLFSHRLCLVDNVTFLGCVHDNAKHVGVLPKTAKKGS